MNLKTSLVGMLGAIGGGLAVLGFQAMMQSKPKPTSVLTAPAVYPLVVATPAAIEHEPRIRVNACRDLHRYVCALKKPGDPTGDVRHDAEGEVETLRIYEDIIRNNPKLSIGEVDELLVKRIYTPGRTKRVREIFDVARQQILNFIDHQPFQNFSEEDRQRLRDRVNSVTLDLPPPASNYADEPDLFTRNDVYYERTADGKSRIRIGGALLFTVRSRYNLSFTLAHEIAHSIDPCELRAIGMDSEPYDPVVQCLGNNESIERQCSAEGQLAERFADWMATHAVAEILSEMETRYTRGQLRSALFNSVRDLCVDDEDLPSGPEIGLASTHPLNEVRVNQIFGQHPKIREILGCSASSQALVGPNQCFWLMGPEAKTR